MPFVWIALSFIAGVFLAAEAGGSITFWLAGLVAVVIAGIGILLGSKVPLLKKLGWRIPATKLPACLLPGFLLAGGVLYLAAQPRLQPDRIFYYNDSGQSIAVAAVVAEPPDYRSRSTLVVLRLVDFKVDGQYLPSRERVMALMPPNTPLQYGDRLILYAHPETPFEDEEFSYRRYLSTKRIFTLFSYPHIAKQNPADNFLFWGWLYRLKAHLIAITSSIFPSPESGLITGIMLGPRNGIPEELYEAFKNSGTSHIIAISGFNIAILAALISLICVRLFGYWRGAMIAMTTISLYAVLVGCGASVIRASLMGGLSILATLFGRRQTGVNTLAFTAFIMLVINPLTLWDIGFQLSFFATLGLIWFAGPFQQWFKNQSAKFVPQAALNRVVDWTGEYFLFTLAAQITTLPILLYHFHLVPLAMLVANPLVLPAQPPLMAASAIAIACGLVWLPLGKFAGLLAVPFSTYTIRIAEWASGLELPILTVFNIPLWALAAYFALLIILVYQPPWLAKLKPALQPGMILFGASLAAALIWHIAVDAPDGKLHITLLDGKNAGAVLVETPSGRFLLINGGEDRNELVSAVHRQLPVHHRKVDLLVLAAEKSSGLLALTGALPLMDIGNVLQVGPLPESRTAEGFFAVAESGGVTIRNANPGDRLNLGGGAALVVEQASEKQRLLSITWQDFSLLLVYGDAANLPPAGVVYLADGANGDMNGFPPQLLIVDGAARAEIVPTLSTLQHGWITLITDGRQMWFEGER